MPKAKKPKAKLKTKKIIAKKIKKPVKKAVKVLVVKKSVVKKKVIVKKKVVAKKKIIKTKKTAPVGEFPAQSLFKARIKVIGIGGGGGSIVSEIGRSLEKANFVVADTDIRALKKKSGIKYFWFGEEQTHGLGTGVNVELGRQAAESAKEKISANFKDQDIIIFIASLGGGLGSGATQVFADAAREFGGITFGIFTMPFKFEGKNKYRIAQTALKSLRQSLNVSLVIPNEKIFKIIDANTAITDAFSIVNKSLIESLESLIDLIYNPGVINIDFADLRTILKGVGNNAFLNTVEEFGKNRAESICEKVLVNPLLQNSAFKAEKILFNIAGSENLSMFEVEKISSHISNSNPEAKIIFGISKNPKLKNKIKTTILMTGGQAVEEVVVKKPELIEEIVQIEIPVKKEVVVEESKIELKQEKKSVEKKKIKKAKKKIVKPKKPVNKVKDNSDRKNRPVIRPDAPSDDSAVSFIPVFQAPLQTKATIRRSGLEIKEAEELQEKKRIEQEKEWEIPAFLRKVKYKN